MSLTPFDHPWMSAHFGDDEVVELFSPASEMKAMLAFEAALARAQAAIGVVPEAAAERISSVCLDYKPDINALRQGVARDGLVVPSLIRELRNTVGKPHDVWLHHGSTSQDVIDTALTLRIKQVFPIFHDRLDGLVSLLSNLVNTYGSRPLKARTRMQVALLISVADRLRAWSDPFARHRDAIATLETRVCKVQFGGAAGNNSAPGSNAPRIASHIGDQLGLTVPEHSWQTERDAIVAFASWLTQVTGACGKVGQDVVLMAQNEIAEVALAGGGGSSAMPHKNNPVAAESVIALHRSNAAALGGLSQALIHEMERSGAAWSLEWMMLPQMIVTTGSALLLTHRLLSSVTRIAGDNGAPSQ